MRNKTTVICSFGLHARCMHVDKKLRACGNSDGITMDICTMYNLEMCLELCIQYTKSRSFIFLFRVSGIHEQTRNKL